MLEHDLYFKGTLLQKWLGLLQVWQDDGASERWKWRKRQIDLYSVRIVVRTISFSKGASLYRFLPHQK